MQDLRIDLTGIADKAEIDRFGLAGLGIGTNPLKLPGDEGFIFFVWNKLPFGSHRVQ